MSLMGLEKDAARTWLKEAGLRATGPRLAVMQVLAAAKTPISHSEVVQRLGTTDWDPATIYRNLVKLKEVGLALVVSRAGGVDRYAMGRLKGSEHRHAHFWCDECGKVACLPDKLTASLSIEEGPWVESVKHAMVQLHGTCPDCLANRPKSKLLKTI